MSSWEICNFSKNTFFTEKLQWLLLRFNSCFQKLVGLSAINTCSAAKKYLLQRKVRRSHRRYSVKKELQLYQKKAPVLRIYKNTRNSHQRCFIIKGVLINFAKFTGKHLCQSLFLNKVAGPRLMICEDLSAIFVITKL